MQEMASLQAMARLAAVALLLGSPAVTALTIEYCSDSNTASSSTLSTSIYQSNGLCEEQCNADYAFAVLQGDDCWCSDYVPESQTDVSECDSSCPGYPSDTCGNSDKGLFGYIAMSSVQPSGTEAGNTGTASATATATTTTSTSSSSEGTATETPTPLVETVTVTESKTTRTTLATSVSTSSSSTTDPPTSTASPTISVQTIAGQPVTITVSDTSSTSTPTASASKSSSLSGGAIAGIVIGSLVGVGAIAAFALWYFFFGRRRSDDRSEKSGSPTANDGSVTGGTIDTRRQSRGSQMSFMRNFMSPAADQETTPTSPTDYLSPSQAFTDNRMKKNAVLYPNGDRQSAVSLRDDEDYSRPVLRLTNPD